MTSPWFANLYLDGIDHYVKETLHIPGYIRYTDDMLLFSYSQAALWAAHDEVGSYLNEERKLCLKKPLTLLSPCLEGIPFLGLRIFPGSWRLQRARFLRARRLLRTRENAFREGRIGAEELARSAGAAQGILSWFGIKGVLPHGLEV